MKESFRQSMAWLHSWAGLLPGWLLFLIFLFGTSAFFQQEINRWMRPELIGTTLSPVALNAADRILRERGVGAESWQVSFPSARGGDPLNVSWTMPKKDGAGNARGERTKVMLDPATGREVAVRDTLGGWFLYRFHFDLHYMPIMWARYAVSIAALAMLIAILSGIITHKKIFTDFFLLRFGKGQRSWLDAHNVLGVMALPFHLMITYTGLVALLFTLMPWAISANFPSRDAFYKTIYPEAPEIEPSGKPATMLPLNILTAQATRHWHGVRPNYLTITHPGDAVSTAEIYPDRDTLGGGRTGAFVIEATTGRMLSPGRAIGGARATQGVMIDLHTGLFAGIVVRWLYFLSGVGGTLMCASGLILWIVKRRAKLPDPARPYFGFRLAERLNIGVIAGTPGGIATYFLANRLLPLSLAQRADWEVNSLFIAWSALLTWSLARPARRAWVELLGTSAVLFALIPLVNAATTPRGLFPSMIGRDWLFVSFDLMMLAFAVALAFAVHRVASHKAKTPARRKSISKLAEANA